MFLVKVVAVFKQYYYLNYSLSMLRLPLGLHQQRIYLPT